MKVHFNSSCPRSYRKILTFVVCLDMFPTGFFDIIVFQVLLLHWLQVNLSSSTYELHGCLDSGLPPTGRRTSSLPKVCPIDLYHDVLNLF
jgi:hypothetical protein